MHGYPAFHLTTGFWKTERLGIFSSTVDKVPASDSKFQQVGGGG